MKRDVARRVLVMAVLVAFVFGLRVEQCRGQSSSPTAQSQQQTVQQPSLGEVARRLKAERAQSGEKAVKVYTNDDLESDTGGISVVGPGPTSPAAAEAPAGSEAASASKRDAQYFREKASRLTAMLQLHQRELAVLQQKLNLNQMQYYPNPNDTLRQEYSRADINKLIREIDAKKAQVQEDQNALTALEQQVRREGGDPAWLRGGSQPGNRQEAGAEAAHASEPEPRTPQEWQRALDAARTRLARAKEEQRLAEDELTLLQTQQARQLATGNTGAIASQITDKKVQVDAARAATAKAQQELEDLERKFQQSGQKGSSQ